MRSIKWQAGYPSVLLLLLAAGLLIGYAYLLCESPLAAFIILALLSLILLSFIQVYYLFAVFPIVYIFTFFPIPHIGSPEKLVVAAIFFLFVCRILGSGRLNFFDSGMAMLFLAYIIAHLPALFYSTAPLQNNLAGIVSHLSMGIFVYLIAAYISDQRHIEACVRGLVMMNIVIAGILLFFAINTAGFTFYRNPDMNHVFQTESFMRFTFMNNPNRLCRVILMTYPFLVLFYLYAESHLAKFTGMLLCFAVPIIVIITYSRMGLITLAVMLLWLALKFHHRTKIFLVILLVFMIGATASSNMIVKRFARLQEQREDYGAVKRYTTWQAGIQGWLAYPLFGVGAGKKAIYETMGKHGATALNPEEMVQVPKAPHSVYLNTLLETGAIGFIALGLFFYELVRLLHKKMKRLGRQTYLHDCLQLGCVSLFSAALMGITANSIWLNIFWFITGLLCAAERAAPETAANVQT